VLNSENLISAYLRDNIKNVRKQLGEGCTYLSFSKEKFKNEQTGKYETCNAFVAMMKNDDGGKDKIVYYFDKPLHTLTGDDFHTLTVNLNGRLYEQRSESSGTV
jgi:hypothetical protein